MWSRSLSIVASLSRRPALRVVRSAGAAVSLRTSSWVPVRTFTSATLIPGTRWTQRRAPPTVAAAGLFAAIGAAGLWATASQGADWYVSESDILYGKNEKLQNFKHLVAAVEKFPDNAEIVWRFARACYDMAALENDNEKKKAFVYQAHELALKALELAPNLAAAHKWRAITISRVGDYEGTKTKIKNSYVIREHFDKASELNPKDATAVHLIGVWCFSIAEMSWLERKAAAAFFATLPSSSYEEALEYFLRAETISPQFYKKNLVMIGTTYLRLKNFDQARAFLEKACSLPVNNVDDSEAHRDAEELLKKLPQ